MLTDGQKETVDRFESTLLVISFSSPSSLLFLTSTKKQQNDFFKLSNGFFGLKKEGEEQVKTESGVCLGTNHLWWGKTEAGNIFLSFPFISFHSFSFFFPPFLLSHFDRSYHSQSM